MPHCLKKYEYFIDIYKFICIKVFKNILFSKFNI